MGEPGYCYGCGAASAEITCAVCWERMFADESDDDIPECIVLGED